MINKRNPMLLEYILAELNKKGVIVIKASSKGTMTTVVGSRRHKLHLRYPAAKDD